jgi:hypothetical protein
MLALEGFVEMSHHCLSADARWQGSHRGASAITAMFNSYAAARLRAKRPIKPRPNNSIAYISGSGTTAASPATCPWLLMAIAVRK